MGVGKPKFNIYRIFFFFGLFMMGISVVQGPIRWWNEGEWYKMGIRWMTVSLPVAEVSLSTSQVERMRIPCVNLNA